MNTWRRRCDDGMALAACLSPPMYSGSAIHRIYFTSVRNAYVLRLLAVAVKSEFAANLVDQLTARALLEAQQKAPQLVHVGTGSGLSSLPRSRSLSRIVLSAVKQVVRIEACWIVAAVADIKVPRMLTYQRIDEARDDSGPVVPIPDGTDGAIWSSWTYPPPATGRSLKHGIRRQVPR